MREWRTTSKWLTIGLTMLIGLFVAYLDRSNLSIALTEMGVDLGFAEDAFVSSSVVTAFSIGYAVSNVLGGVITRKMDPKAVATSMVIVWSLGTVATGLIHSVPLLYVFRILLGVCEGFYWPQMSRIVLGWFALDERTRANSIWQDGQHLGKAAPRFHDGCLTVPRDGVGLGVEVDRAKLDAAHRLYVDNGCGTRDDAAGMQFLIPGWEYDPHRPALVR